MTYSRDDYEKDIDPYWVVACVDIDGPNEVEATLLIGPRNQHLQLPSHAYQA